jgi:hypothetical protein
MVGASAVARLVREIIKDRGHIEFGDLLRRIYACPVADLRPVQKEIVASELVELGFRRRGSGSVWFDEK